MPSQPFFYRSWPSVYQLVFGIAFVVFMAALLSSIVAWIQYPAPTFTWQQWQELQRIALPIHIFETSGIPLVISGENYLLLERWTVSPMGTNTDALNYYLFFFGISMAAVSRWNISDMVGWYAL